MNTLKMHLRTRKLTTFNSPHGLIKLSPQTKFPHVFLFLERESFIIFIKAILVEINVFIDFNILESGIFAATEIYDGVDGGSEE